MKQFIVAAALWACAIAASAEITFGPARPLTAEVAVGPVAGGAKWPAAASSGDQFLVGWNDTRSGALAPRVTRLSADGEVLDPAGIGLPSGGGLLLGIGSSGREYLVAMSRGLFIVTRDGAVMRGDAAFFAEAPLRVISNGIDYIVGGDLRVDRTGKVLGRLAKPVRLGAGTLYVGTEPGFMTLLAPDGTIEKFTAPCGVADMAAGSGEIGLLCTDGTNQWIERFSLRGAPLGADIPIVPPPSQLLRDYEAALGWDGTSYAVFYGSLIGVERGGAIVLERRALTATSPRMVSSPHGALAVWVDSHIKQAFSWRDQIATTLLRHDAGVAAARDVIVSLSEHAQTSPRILTAGGRQLAAFIEASAERGEIVVVPASGGDEMLRLPGKNHLYGLRAATNGQELFLLWADVDLSYTVRWRAAIVTPALQATPFDLGTADVDTDRNVLWNGSEYLVYGALDTWLRFAPGGRPLPPSQPLAGEWNWRVPAVASANGKSFMAYCFYIQNIVSAGPQGWYEVHAVPFLSRYFQDVTLETNALGLTPDVAMAGSEVLVVTQWRAFALSAADPWADKLSADVLWNTLAPHVVARDGAFLVSAGGRIARIADRRIAEMTALPESAGVQPSVDVADRVLESVVPAEGPLTIFYSAPVDGRAPRLLVRDLVVPPRHRAAGR